MKKYFLILLALLVFIAYCDAQAVTPKATIKTWFETGDKPTQQQFWNVFDSYWHKDELIPISKIDGLDSALNQHIDESDPFYSANGATKSALNDTAAAIRAAFPSTLTLQQAYNNAPNAIPNILGLGNDFIIAMRSLNFSAVDATGATFVGSASNGSGQFTSFEALPGQLNLESASGSGISINSSSDSSIFIHSASHKYSIDLDTTNTPIASVVVGADGGLHLGTSGITQSQLDDTAANIRADFPINGFLKFDFYNPEKNDSSEATSVSNRYKLQQAVDSAAQSHLKLIISGTYYFDSSIIINGDMHNFEIVGDKGATLILKSRAADTIKRVCFYFQDSAGLKPYNIAFRNFTIDGNKQGNENLISGTEGAGVRMRDTSTNSNTIFEGMTFQNCWANGLNIYSKWVYVTNCSFLHNWNSGLGANPGSGVVANNIVALYNKGGFGVDASGGKMIINNLVSMYNMHGMKTSQEQSFLQADNINISYNDSVGFYQTQTPDSATIQIGKMKAEGNGTKGVSIGQGKNVHIADLTLINNNTLVAGLSNNDIDSATIGNLYIEEKGTLPALVITGGTVNINFVKARENTGSIIFNILSGNLSINSGFFVGNKSTAFYHHQSNAYLSVNNVVFQDSTINPTFDIASASRTYISGCDFTNKLGTKATSQTSSYIIANDNFGWDKNYLLDQTASLNIKGETFVSLANVVAAKTVTMPTAVGRNLQEIIIVNKSTSVGLWSVVGAKFINGTSVSALDTMASYLFKSNGTDWILVNKTTQEATNGSGTISASDITWAGTAPTAPTSLIYNWTKNQKGEVSLHIMLDYSSAGSSNNVLTIAFNSNFPTPLQRITGASKIEYSGSGFLAATDTDGGTTTGRCVIRRNAADNGYEIRLLQPAVSAQFAIIDIMYTAQ